MSVKTGGLVVSVVSEGELTPVLSRIFAGVDYDFRTGAICPGCGVSKAKITRTMPWDECSMRARYHKCPHCGSIFKSIEKR